MYRWVDHTSELELHVESNSPTLVLKDTIAALRELFGSASGEAETHQLSLEAPDLPSLLAAWLDELAFLAETKGFVPDDAQIVLSNTTLRATVHGRRGEPPPLVKAVTYHRLAFGEADGRWRARVVLDV